MKNLDTNRYYWTRLDLSGESLSSIPWHLWGLSLIFGFLLIFLCFKKDLIKYLKIKPFETSIIWVIGSGLIGLPSLILSPFILLGYGLFYLNKITLKKIKASGTYKSKKLSNFSWVTFISNTILIIIAGFILSLLLLFIRFLLS